MSQSVEQKGGSVLVVDDDPVIRLLARTTLVQAGYRVWDAADGGSALELFRAADPDLVLLDIQLPDTDGFKLCAAIRAMPQGKDTPVVMMTGLDDSESIMTAYQAGATDFITKPVSWQSLAYRVHYIFRASQAFRDLRESEARLSQAQQIARMGSWEWRPAAKRIQMSETCRLILELPGRGDPLDPAVILAMVHPEDLDGLKSSFRAASATLAPICTDFRVICHDHSERHLHAEAKAVQSSHDQAVRVTGILQDITERKKAEERIQFLAYYDNLTGLANRLLFKEHLKRALTLAQRQHRKLAILFIDLDRFKEINDSFGHSIGDLLLQGIAERLQHCIRGSDAICRKSAGAGEWSIARLGGDEFMILLDSIASADGAVIVARRIIESLKLPFKLTSHEVCITCSIGISLFPDDGTEPEDLVKNSDIAMYAAKELGRNTFQFYRSEMNSATLQRLMMETLLRGAIERGEFVLHYQPQIDSATGRVSALEALIRWLRPETGLISPAIFIPIAEESGLIIDIDEWVLNSVCRQLKGWQDEGITPVRVAVNLSGRHFQRNTLVASVSRALADSGVAPDLLELELTEGVLMEQLSETVNTLRALREMGVGLSIDDFGVGYSSLNYLKNFPITTLKVDRCFVSEVGKGIEGPAIIKAIIALAQGLGYQIIAEGVETDEQLAFLNANGCSIIQGYLYSQPLPLAEVSAILREQRSFAKSPFPEPFYPLI